MKITNKKNSLVLSDIDGTLVKGSLVLGHAVWLQKKGLIDTTLHNDWLANQKCEKTIYGFAVEYSKAIAGKTKQDILAKEYVQEVIATEEYYSTMSRIKQVHDESVVILISGSPKFLTEHFAGHYGFHSFGTQYVTDSKKRFTGEMKELFTKNAKKRIVDSLPIDNYSHVTSYGDTVSDSPLLEVADYSALVAPTEHTLVAYNGVRVDEIIND